MSKAFTREETEEAPVTVRPRAALPPGVPNYVTPAGLAALTLELQRLKEDRARLQSSGSQRTRDRALADGRILQLEERLALARLVDTHSQPQDEVRFGATVGVRSESGALQTFQIVGVDEADVKGGKIAFNAPLARALLGRKVGEVVSVATPQNDEERTVISIGYW